MSYVSLKLEMVGKQHFIPVLLKFMLSKDFLIFVLHLTWGQYAVLPWFMFFCVAAATFFLGMIALLQCSFV